MYYNLIERNKYGGKQINRVYLPYKLNISGWSSCRLLAETKQVPINLAERYKYICLYDPDDWVDEEQKLYTSCHGEYYLNHEYARQITDM